MVAVFLELENWVHLLEVLEVVGMEQILDCPELEVWVHLLEVLEVVGVEQTLYCWAGEAVVSLEEDSLYLDLVR